jgi:hypothetical protein
MAGGLITFSKYLVWAVKWLYGFALSPNGMAAVVVGTAVVALLSLIVALIKP